MRLSNFCILSIFYFAFAYAQAELCPSDNDEKRFNQRQLQGKRFCKELTRNECLFIHEAGEKCTCTCDVLIHEPALLSKEEPKQAISHNEITHHCFHGDAWVNTSSGKVLMKDLPSKSNHVLTRLSDGSLDYSPISAWIHAARNVQAEFVSLETMDGHRILLTPLHLIYETNCAGVQQTIMAQDITLSRCVLVIKGDKVIESKVIRKSRQISTGIYSPITSEGNIIVNGVLTSCYSSFNNERLQHILFGYLTKIPRFLCNVFSILPHAAEGNQPIPHIVHSFISLKKYLIQ